MEKTKQLLLADVKAAMLAKLKTSLLTPAHAKTLRLEAFAEGHKLNIEPKWAGFKIPYFDLDGKLDAEFFRFRFLQTKPTHGWGALTEDDKPRRYAQPADTGCGVYLPPVLNGPWRAVAEDSETPIMITEGELKAACACIALDVPTLGLGGVFNWRSSKLHQPLLPVLEEFAWQGRVVNLCFDSDIAINPMVRMAASRLAHVLADRGAEVLWTSLSPAMDGSKQGLDDLAYAEGIPALAKLLGEAVQLGPGVMLHKLNCEVALVRATGEVAELATGNVYSAPLFADVVYRHRHYTDWKEKTSVERFAAKEWLAWKYRNEVPRIVYAPDEPTLLTRDGSYNSWYPSQWAIAPSKTGSIRPWEELLARMFHGLAPDVVQWIRRWFAYPLQHPGAKLYTALLVWGYQQGTGKTMLGETMASIYGDNYGTVNNAQLAGQFNEWAERKQFIVGDEIALGDKRHTANTLKDMITRNILRLNSKNRKTYAVRDCINYYFTSNHEDAVYLEGGDRRMFVHKVDTEPLRPEEYQAYQKWLKADGAARLFEYLLHEVDLGDFDPQGRAPLTSAKAEMMAAGRGDTEDWAVHVKIDPDAVVPQPYDLFRTVDLLKFYDPDSRERTRVGGMGRALAQAGVFKVAGGNNSAMIEGARTRFWAVRNAQRYLRIGPAEAKAAYVKERAGTPNAVTETAPRSVGVSAKFTRGRVQ